ADLGETARAAGYGTPQVDSSSESGVGPRDHGDVADMRAVHPPRPVSDLGVAARSSAPGGDAEGDFSTDIDTDNAIGIDGGVCLEGRAVADLGVGVLRVVALQEKVAIAHADFHAPGFVAGVESSAVTDAGVAPGA